MANIYITGHRNPDLDTVCAAQAYATFKNIIDPENHYIPVRCGHLSGNVKKVLATMGITPPPYMHDVYPKVKDVMLSEQYHVDADESLSQVAKHYRTDNPPAVPVYRGNDFYGLLTVDDIATWYLQSLANNEIKEDPKISEVMGPQGEPLFEDERYEEAMQRLLTSHLRGLPVVRGDEFVGYVTRRCFMERISYNVIMVDHNEPEQSIPGVETAKVLEIVDHHRLDSVKTDVPIFIDAEPVGSTCTIVYQLYRRNMMTPDRDTARVLLTGIMADTLILKSPTTTIVDVRSAQELSWITGEDAREFGEKMFSATEAMQSRDPKEAIESDFKIYHDHNIKVGIGQCEATTLMNLQDFKDIYLKTLEDVRLMHGLDWAMVMITDVLHERSILLSTDFRSRRHLPYT